jgi:lipopolysaccharide cholinephosphotransferase
MSKQLQSYEIHDILFSILAATVELCEAEKIEYFLIGGACLGIARHNHQLIPWDDDIDISIWAGDVQRFLQAMRKLPAPYCAEIKEQVSNPTVKIMDTSTRIVFDDSKLSGVHNLGGIFIDVVPMMHWRSLGWKKLDDLYALGLAMSNSTNSPTYWKRVVKKTLRLTGCLWLIRFIGQAVYEPLVSKINTTCRQRQLGYISGASGRKWIARCPRGVIFPVKKERLGSLWVNVPNNLNEYLRIRYGEAYMQTPDPSVLWKHFDRAFRVEQ